MDKLFLLNPSFTDNRLEPKDQLYFCPFNAMLEGVLKYYPELKDELEIIYVNFERPRQPICELLGEEHQGTPLLIIENKDLDISTLNVKDYNGKSFIVGPSDIVNYFALAYKIPIPHP